MVKSWTTKSKNIFVSVSVEKYYDTQQKYYDTHIM